MWLQRATNYLLRHKWQALVLTFFSTFIPIVGIVGIVVAALITLVKGVVEGAIFTLAATLPYIISFYFSGNEPTTVPIVLWAAVGVAVLSNILTWVFAVMLRRQASWSAILQVAALIGVLAISVIHLAFPEVADWWGNELQSYYAQAQAITGAIKGSVTTANDSQLEAINIFKQYATGMMVSGILFNAVLQLIVARWWQSIVYSPGLLRLELHGIRLSPLAGILFICSIIFYYLGNGVVLDIMPVLYVLFGAAGLSLVHYLFGLVHSPSKWFWLSLFYAALIIAVPVSVILIAFVALSDIWLDVRKRLKKT